MDSDTIPLQPEALSQTKFGPGQISGACDDGIILATAPASPASQNMPVPLGPEKTITVCHHCHASIRTSIRYTSTTRTHQLATLWCFLCGCCCLPHCMTSTRNCDHYCPNCSVYLGTYKK